MKCKCPNYIKVIDKGLPTQKILFRNSSRFTDYTIERDYESDIDWIQVPCGNCMPCRLNYSREWANRCYLESLEHPFTWFITLTYKDENLVYGSKGFPTVEKDAISKFMKNLRNKFPGVKLKFFGCSEYGEAQGERAGFNPHYHLIVFGAPLSDLTIDLPDMTKEKDSFGKYPVYQRKNSDGDYVYWSDTVFDCWKKGKIEVENASWNCAAYVSRYVVKKHKGLSFRIYKKLGIEPEFLRMSNRPGIAANYLMQHKDSLLDTDYISIENKKGVQTSHPPRYFTKLMTKDEDSLDAALMESNLIQRKLNARKRCKDSTSKKSVKQKLIDEAEIIEAKTNLFTRKLT